MAESSPVQHLVREYLEDGKLVGMICAGAPRACAVCPADSTRAAGSTAALTSGLPRQPLTSHPSVRPLLEKGASLSLRAAV